MCGIYGFNWDDKSLLKSMQKSLQYRGPDSSGFYADGKMSIGNCRLAIIDLKSGKQPIHNEDSSLWITFNGEIYNYLELRNELEKKGHSFYTDSDTEVILHAYEEYCEKCVLHLNGMFAFCIYDKNKHQLFLARDRVGIKPLYYWVEKNRFMFASEIKAIVENRQIRREINYAAFDSLFTFRYISGKETILKNISKLLPGNYMIFRQGKVLIKKYWDMQFVPVKSDEKLLVNELDVVLASSVKRQMQSDVPIGVFLSGGIDSSALTYYLAKLGKSPIRTFTLGFAGDSNEHRFARIISDEFGTDHSEIDIEPESISTLPKIVWHMDEPVADPTALPTYLLSKEASKKVKVVLSGDGCDELFGGYEQYKMMKLIRFYQRYMQQVLKKPIAGLGSLFPEDPFFNKLKSLLKNRWDMADSYIRLLSIYDESEKKELYQKSVINNLSALKPNLDSMNDTLRVNSDPVNKMQLFDIKNWLPDDILLKYDRMAMANSIEGRVPFLDNAVIEYASKLSSGLRVKGLQDKYILRKAMKDKLPQVIIARKKQRFYLPLDSWYQKVLKDYCEKILCGEETSVFFRKKYIAKLLEYQKSFSYKSMLRHNNLFRLYYPRQLWTILTFELWHRMYIDGEDYKKL